jgi:diaminopimelate epimerase
MDTHRDVWEGHPFAKMTGSGNDFVLFDTLSYPLPEPISHEVIRHICNRRNGIGADGVVVLSAGAKVAATVSYYNADGSLGELCGNATLCSTAWCVSHGYAPATSVQLATDSGLVSARHDGDPSILLPRVTEVSAAWAPSTVEPGERRLGFARVGVPHVVVLVDQVDAVAVDRRGAELRRDVRLGTAGANANFVGRDADGRWRLRTFERGVEAETLACGTGAVATAILLTCWGLVAGGSPVGLITHSGRALHVELAGSADEGWVPRLSGEGRVVFEGQIRSLVG